MSEQELIHTRREKHREFNGGTYPLASPGGSTVGEILLKFVDNQVPISIDPNELNDNVFLTRGRIQTIRKGGSISFVTLYDRSGVIQLIASKSTLLNYKDLRFADLGDIIEVVGKPCLSKTGEKSILLLDWKILSKAIQPPPEKFAGLSDTEIKYRQRYVDLLSSDESRATFIVRSYMIRGLRDYMEHEGFLEVETSTLNTVNSGANAKPFTTHHNSLGTDLFLRIAPELYLKRLLVGGLDKVFEIGRNYRNEGLSTRHNPEFTMMEFYEAYGNFPRLVDRTKAMLVHIENFLEKNLPSNVLPIYLRWRQNRSFTFNEFVVVSMLQATRRGAAKAGFDIEITRSGIQWQQISQVAKRSINVNELHHAISNCKTTGQVLCTLFEYFAEPFLIEDYRTADGMYSIPVFITDYPKDICPLARAKDTDATFCDRFELFIDGRELCNAFQELNDPQEQETRFKEQLQFNSKDPMQFDSDYITALNYGMPPAIGFGIGLDRLAMLITNSNSIRDVILFPTMKSIGG